MGYCRWSIEDSGAWRDIIFELLMDSHKIIEAAGISGRCWADYEDGKIQSISLGGCEDETKKTKTMTADLFTFGISERKYSCETNQKSYDLAVRAILIRAHHLAPNVIKITSKRNEDSGWHNACELICKLWPDKAVICFWELRDGESLELSIRRVFSTSLNQIVTIRVVAFPL